MTYTKAFRLSSSPTGRTDNSAQISHDIWAVYDVGGTWTIVPGYHKTILVPATDAETIMDMPDSTGTQRQAKNQAYKNLLMANRNTSADPHPSPSAIDWTDDGIDAYIDAYAAWVVESTTTNAHAALQASRVNEYIVTTLGLTYPVEFNL